MSSPPPLHIDLGKNSVAIVGGGLVGCLLAIYLKVGLTCYVLLLDVFVQFADECDCGWLVALRQRHGFCVAIFESRADPRGAMEVGRSINLVITSRGLHALTSVSPSLAAQVMAVTTRVDGRTLHNRTPHLTLA